MACGKSALAKALSSSLDRTTVDLDHHVENQWERTIEEGIEQFGELEFRRIERILLRELPTENQILSTGGGTACFYGNMDWMLANGLVVYLKMSPSNLSQRIIADREAGIVRHLVDFVSDWYGLDYVAFAKGSVDPFNPKVVQSSMGAMARMPVVLMPEEALSQQLTAEGRTLFLADMGGKPVEQMPWPERSALVMGNEGAGPSEHWKTVTDQVVSIRRAKGRQTESLNVAMAGGILMQAWHIA